jgi:hypothetical protein
MTHEIPDGFEFGDRSAEFADAPEGRDGEVLLHKCCADLGVNMAVALQIVAWAEENTEARSSKLGDRSKNTEQGRLMASVIKILEYLRRHPGAISVYAVCYVFDLPLLDDINGHLCPAEFAKSVNVSREAVNKEVLAAQKHFQLPPRRGQRSDRARKNMTTARLRQLHK